MKTTLSFIFFIFLTLNFLASPFHFLNIKEKVPFLVNKSDFKRVKIKTDSVVFKVAHWGSSSQPTTSHYIYYDNDKLIILQDNRGNQKRLFGSKTKQKNTINALKYIEQHNDSILIWHHPTLNGQIAFTKKEVEMNTNGYLIQIIVNTILLIVAAGNLIWLIRKVKNSKK